MRRKPGQDKWNALVFAHGKLGDGFQFFSVRLDRRAKNQRIGTSHRLKAAMAPAHPWNDRAVIEPYDQFHSDRDLRRPDLRRSGRYRDSSRAVA